MSDEHVTMTQPTATAVWERRDFLLHTYGHLLGAIIAFVVLEMFYFATGIAESVAGALLSINWLFVLGGFVVVGFVARGFAASPRSHAMQYAGLGGYVIADSKTPELDYENSANGVQVTTNYKGKGGVTAGSVTCGTETGGRASG